MKEDVHARPISQGADDVTECPLCFERFNSENKTPRLLVCCSNTYCAECLNDIKAATSELTCPVCRKVVQTDIDDIPLNRAVLNLLNAQELCSECKVRPRCLACSHCQEHFCEMCLEKHHRIVKREKLVEKRRILEDLNKRLTSYTTEYLEMALGRLDSLNSVLDSPESVADHEEMKLESITSPSEEFFFRRMIDDVKKAIQENDVNCMPFSVERGLQCDAGSEDDAVIGGRIVMESRKVMVVLVVLSACLLVSGWRFWQVTALAILMYLMHIYK